MRKEIIKPYEIISEIKEKYEVPSFEEFMKTYESDETVVKSYEDELEAKAIQGPQYGPGKSDFSGLCRRIKNELGYNLTCRISCDSDSFYSWKKYVGAIIYAMNGKHRWEVDAGRACGRNGRAFYMIVKCTEGWQESSSDYRYGIGGGIFHGWLIKDEFGFDLNVYDNQHDSSKNKICCGGFAWIPSRSDELSFNSYTLNSHSQVGGSSDGSNNMSSGEKTLVRYCFNEYKTRGPGSTFDVPSYYLP